MFVSTLLFPGVARGEPRILLRVDFFQTQVPEVHPVFSEHLLMPPLLLEIEPAAQTGPGSLDRLVAAGLLEGGEGGVKAISHGRIRAEDVVRKPPPMRSGMTPKSEPFGLLKTMPASYAGVMFGIGWLLLLISLALGYLGRETTPYSANDPATWDPQVRRPLAAIVFEPNSEV